MEPAVIDACVARIEQRIADRSGEGEQALKRKRDHQKEMVLGSMAISIPLLAIAAVFTGLPGVVAVCLALAVIRDRLEPLGDAPHRRRAAAPPGLRERSDLLGGADPR
jgi:hypothetical protein